MQINVQHFGVWNAFVGTTLVAAASSGLAWFALRIHDLPTAAEPTTGALDASGWCITAVLVVVFAATCSAFRRRPVALRWDTQCWHLTCEHHAGNPAGPLHARVMVDVGGWMLLKFVPDCTAATKRAHWVAVQRSGLEVQWHALRCALYSPRTGALGMR